MERKRQGRYDDDDDDEEEDKNKIQYQVLRLGKVLCKYVNLHRFVLAKAKKRGRGISYSVDKGQWTRPFNSTSKQAVT